ncbi:probable ADP-ribosylation factor GTPase-activating protein AGD14 isoform X2 [Punica granatum]|uniref:Probable ADP-ribosylation factor GTPase-activating protein AGD14 isoform X2 n=1 Tax=Punica granatum TaxID=22663 RepID=A0A6P8BRE2_PUNGR|nr:probable ADP-ribosylation factor GTPase-activating protein AGD14 isoform X2 [Punica granatum]
MANKKMKEDERIERAIRSLLKLPENRRCINCNSVGPQYVCTTFWTFICTNCSGIHREFTHRVKSVSIAKFTTDEVSALQAGGNERARQIYFKEWDPHCNSQPDNSNLYKLRDFIKHVYVDQKFTGEKETEKLPRVRLADKVNSSESRRPSSSRIGLSSPSYEDRYDHHYHSARSGPSPSAKSDDGIVRYYYDESRSPRYTQQSSRTGYRRSPARFEVVDDRFRDDGYGSRRRSTNAMRLMSEDFRVIGRRSFDGLQKNAEKPSISLEARLERELSRQASQSKAPSSPSQGSSSNENKAKEEKVANQGSLIDCGDDSKPPDVQKQQRPPPMATTTTTTNTNTMTTVTAPPAAANNDETNWAPFGSSTEEKKAPTKPSNPNTLEFLLFELAGPAPLPGPSSNEVFSGVDQPTTVQNVIPTTEHNIIVGPSRLPEPESVDATSPASHPNASIQQPLDETSGGSPDDGANLVQFPVSHQYHQPPTSAPAENMSLQEQPIPSAPAENMSIQEQPISSAPAPSVETGIQQQSANSPGPAQNVKTEPETSSFMASQSPQLERKPSGRRELPADLFTVLYPQAPAPVRTWQPVPLQGFGFNMHYYPPNMMQLGAYSNSPKSTNPFDVGMEGTEPQRPMFPSTVPMQGALFNNDISAPSGPFSLGLHPSCVPPMQPQSPSHGPAFSSGVYMGQQHGQGKMPFSSLQQQQHGYEGFGGNPNHQMMSYPGAIAPNYSSSSPVGGGNPFD